MLKAIFAQENQAVCLRKAPEVAEYLWETMLGSAEKNTGGRHLRNADLCELPFATLTSHPYQQQYRADQP